MTYSSKYKISSFISGIGLIAGTLVYRLRSPSGPKELIYVALVGIAIGIPAAVFAIYYRSMARNEAKDLDIMQMGMLSKLSDSDKTYVGEKLTKDSTEISNRYQYVEKLGQEGYTQTQIDDTEDELEHDKTPKKLLF